MKLIPFVDPAPGESQARYLLRLLAAIIADSVEAKVEIPFQALIEADNSQGFVTFWDDKRKVLILRHAPAHTGAYFIKEESCPTQSKTPARPDLLNQSEPSGERERVAKAIVSALQSDERLAELEDQAKRREQLARVTEMPSSPMREVVIPSSVARPKR